jgi:PilZ domain
MTERRGAKRRPLKASALVYFGRKRGVFAGLVCDMSDTGAKIQLGRLAIPKRFALSFDNFLTVRQCRLVWKRDGLAGIAFEPSTGIRHAKL